MLFIGPKTETNRFIINAYHSLMLGILFAITLSNFDEFYLIYTEVNITLGAQFTVVKK